ncbi:hypothetical protein [Micromonospora rubida]|uniref:hypothetical protein n=1 Tax=Micromonospora rubida TaxID=2697657 RepID=UPI001377237B|nr:hypothetical protein [Micromonospora rubida]NBE81973.1 hypothetical protein [Micromonospora rubida]
MTEQQPPVPAPARGPANEPGPAAGPDRYAVAHVDEQIQLPDWMRQVGTEQPLDRTERRRLAWGRHRGKLLVGVVALGAVALLGATVTVVRTVVDGVRTATPSTPSPSPSPGPVSSAGAHRDYFAGTPAAGFAVGEQGIQLPTARPTGPFSAAQVRTALDTTRRALIESRLSTVMLYGNYTPFLTVLAEDAREDLSPAFADARFQHFATRLDRSFRWKKEIRVAGKVDYEATENADGIRVLAVTTRFSWVYAFERLAGEAPPEADLVVVRDTVVWYLPHPDDVSPSARGLWLGSAEAVTWNAECGLLREEGFLDVAPWVSDGNQVGPSRGVPLTEVFDPEQAAHVPGSC